MGETMKIKLKGGAIVWATGGRATSCKSCGAKIWFGHTEKNNKIIPIEELKNGEYQAHFVSCPNAGFHRGSSGLGNRIREKENNQDYLNNL